jgi:hypothetical protein
MNARRTETGLAWFTLGALAIFAPLETWASLPYGLTHPMYLVDVVGMGLMLFGGVHSLNSRPVSAAGPLCAAWAWCGASGWRATSWRWIELRAGGELDHGGAELAFVVGATGLTIVCLGLSLVLAVRSPSPSA